MYIHKINVKSIFTKKKSFSYKIEIHHIIFLSRKDVFVVVVQIVPQMLVKILIFLSWGHIFSDKYV